MEPQAADKWERWNEAYPVAARTKVRALLVDDDPLDSALVTRLAARSSQFDIVLTVCRSVEDAGNVLARAEFEILLIDYWLGFDTSIAFIYEQSRSGRTPCVLLTGLDAPDIRRCAFRAGVDGYLAKENLSIQAIEGVLCAVLARKHRLS
jgi:DNA-binding NarL/FixJ family response regulator